MLYKFNSGFCGIVFLSYFYGDFINLIMKKNCTIIVKGYVYKVGFRTYAIMEAYKRGITGEVRNTHRDELQI